MPVINLIIACFQSKYRYSNGDEINGAERNYVSFEYFGYFLKKMGEKLGQ